jgi:hypothetical protein
MTFFKALAPALLLFALAACTPPKPPTEGSGEPSQSMISAEAAAAIKDPAECAAKGGSIRPVCRMQNPTCVLTYADVSKACTDDSDCQGKCILAGDPPADRNTPVTGECQADSDPCGCRTEVKGGKAQDTICVD